MKRLLDSANWGDLKFLARLQLFLARLSLFWHDFYFFGTTLTFLARLQLYWHGFQFLTRHQIFWHDFDFFGTTSHDFQFGSLARLGLFLGSFCEPLTTFICRRQPKWRLQSHGWGCFIWFLSQLWESVLGFFLVIFLH